MRARSLRVLAFAGSLVATAFVLASPLGAAERNGYVVTNLVSNSATVPAATHDPSLVNAWGLTASQTSPWWVADNGADVSTLYNGTTGAKVALTVAVEGGPDRHRLQHRRRRNLPRSERAVLAVSLCE